MAVVKAQQIPRPEAKFDPEDIIASFCYHFPQYKFSEARQLPFKRIRKMLKVAEREYAKKMHDLILIVSAPHTKNPNQSVQKMLEYFKKVIEED